MNDERRRFRPSLLVVAGMGLSTAALGLALVDHIKPSPPPVQPSSQKPDSPVSQAAPEAADPPDPEAQRHQEATWWEGVLKAHGQQRRDAAWAEKAERLFQADLSVIAKGRRFEALDADCRTTSCAVTLKWPSYSREEIRKDAGDIAGYLYQENCATSILVPPPEDLGAPYQAQVVFTCAQSRSSLAHR